MVCNKDCTKCSEVEFCSTEDTKYEIDIEQLRTGMEDTDDMPLVFS